MRETTYSVNRFAVRALGRAQNNRSRKLWNVVPVTSIQSTDRGLVLSRPSREGGPPLSDLFDSGGGMATIEIWRSTTGSKHRGYCCDTWFSPRMVDLPYALDLNADGVAQERVLLLSLEHRGTKYMTGGDLPEDVRDLVPYPEVPVPSESGSFRFRVVRNDQGLRCESEIFVTVTDNQVTVDSMKIHPEQTDQFVTFETELHRHRAMYAQPSLMAVLVEIVHRRHDVLSITPVKDGAK